MPKGKAVNVYVPNELIASLDAIGAAMGEGEIGIRPTRSQLFTKAIENFIAACAKNDHLKLALGAVKSQVGDEASAKRSFSRDSKGLRVVAPGA